MAILGDPFGLHLDAIARSDGIVKDGRLIGTILGGQQQQAPAEISAREYPNSRSAPSLQPVRMPSSVAAMTPSLADSVRDTSSSARTSLADSAAEGFPGLGTAGRRRADSRARPARLACCEATRGIRRHRPARALLEPAPRHCTESWIGSAAMEHVTLDDSDDGVVVMTADRAPANAMDLTLLGDILEALDRLASDLPRALVLAGRAGFFSAGADLKAIPDYDAGGQRRMVSAINDMALGLYELPCPVVGAITGHAIAVVSCSPSARTSAWPPARAATA